MDMIALSKANKAKRSIKKVNDRLGTNVALTFGSVKKRIEFLESKDPKAPGSRISALEANTHINLNKHNLRVETLMNKSRFDLKDAIVDDFEDATGLNLATSTNVTHDVTNHLIKVTTQDQDAILNFKKETLATPASIFTISFVSSRGVGLTEPIVELKQNDGGWIEVKKDDITYAKAGQEWTSLEIRVKLKKDQQLNAISYSWT